MRAVRSAHLLASLFATALICAPASATRDLSVELTPTAAGSGVPAAVPHILPGEERAGEPTSLYGAWMAIVLGFGLLGAASRRGTPHSHDEMSF